MIAAVWANCLYNKVVHGTTLALADLYPPPFNFVPYVHYKRFGNEKKRNDIVMTYLNKICSRCTRRAYCICFDELCFCDSCYETMLNDPETKALMKTILKNYGQN